MKCPHCDYEHGWSGEFLKCIEGQEGKFYKSLVQMQRDSDNYRGMKDTIDLYGCPSCFKTFIDKD